jgi:hypothetical protein
MTDKYNYELIRDYLHGVLDKNTAARVGELIRTDETARSIAAGIIQLEEEFKDELEAEKYLEAFHEKQTATIRHNKPFTISFKPLLRIAAALVVLIGVGFVIRYVTTPNLNELVNQELSMAYPIPTLSRDGEATGLDQAYQLYSEKKFARAADLFHQVGAKAPEQTAIIFYEGISRLYAGEYRPALELLENQMLTDSRFEQQARWFRAVAYLKLKNHERANIVLREIVNQPRHYKQKLAREILEAVD